MKLETKLALDYYLGGFMHFMLKPVVYITGKILRRNHDFGQIKKVAVLKLLGGGSVVLAYPALLGFKQARPDCKLVLVATHSTKIYADELGIFDEIIVMDDSSMTRLLCTALIAARKLFACDCIVDMEVHSRLSTVFTLATCARNRIGFYTETGLWRRYIYTHLLFFNNQSGVYFFYDQVTQLFGGKSCAFSEAIAKFRETHCLGPRELRQIEGGIRHVAIAPCCSGLGRTRMFSADEWAVILPAARKNWDGNCTIHIFGSQRDMEYCDALAQSITATFSGVSSVSVNNLAGRLKMHDTLMHFEKMDVVYCIDSGLLHFARLLGMPVVSYWGPTAPQTRLMDSSPERDVIHYVHLPCSPCVHMTSNVPCLGNNICMKMHIVDSASLPHNPPWIDRTSAKIQRINTSISAQPPTQQ